MEKTPFANSYMSLNLDPIFHLGLPSFAKLIIQKCSRLDTQCLFGYHLAKYDLLAGEYSNIIGLYMMTKDGFSISNSLFVHLHMLNWHRYFADICKKFQHICEISANIVAEMLQI